MDMISLPPRGCHRGSNDILRSPGIAVLTSPSPQRDDDDGINLPLPLDVRGMMMIDNDDGLLTPLPLLYISTYP